MLRIVPQVIPADNEETYRRAVEEVQVALRRAVAVHVTAGAPFRDQEVAVLAAANDACRLELEAALQTTADAQSARVRIAGTVYERHQDVRRRTTVSAGRSTCAGRRIGRRENGTVRQWCRWSWPRD